MALNRTSPFAAQFVQSHDLVIKTYVMVLQSALHRRSAFAAGAGVLPPGLGVVPTHDGPFPPQALILRDNSHRREAYANGQGTLPPAPPPPFGIRPVQTHNLSSAVSSDLDSPLDSTSASFVNLGEISPKALPDERKMRHVESFNTDVVRQSIDKANRQEVPEKAITSAGKLTSCSVRSSLFSM